MTGKARDAFLRSGLEGGIKQRVFFFQDIETRDTLQFVGMSHIAPITFESLRMEGMELRMREGVSDAKAAKVTRKG
jgi:hypothetical protein